MSAFQRSILSTAIGIALTLFVSGCSDRSEAPAPPTSAQREPAQPIAEAPPPKPAEAPKAAASKPAPAAPAEAPEASAAGAAGPGDAKAGQADYQLFCASCHGETGAGDGPVAQALNPKPAHHNDGNYMNPLTDDYIFEVIKFGGGSVGKSTMMAPWGGTLSDQRIRNLVAYIRTLADPPYRP